ncbi:MAG: hypothetical protein WCJ24_03580 [Candidatus Saccharibacteria bacterium]
MISRCNDSNARSTPEIASNPSEDIILSYADFEQKRLEEGFNRGHHGTFWTPEKSKFMYKKPCHRVDNLEQARESLALLRYATAKGVLFPETEWGTYLNPDGTVQLYAVTPQLANYTDNKNAPDPDRESLKHIPADSGAGLFDEGSQVLALYRRLDLNFDPVVGPEPGSVLNLLNPFEALHSDNWGWDESGKLYPIDVEVIEVSGSPEITSIVHNWYVQNNS